MLYFSSTVKRSILTPTQSRFKYLWKILYAHVTSTFVIRHMYRKVFGTKYSGLDVKKEGIKQLDSISFERKIEFLIYMFDPFPATALFLYPQKTLEKLCLADVFSWYGKRALSRNRFMSKAQT